MLKMGIFCGIICLFAACADEPLDDLFPGERTTFLSGIFLMETDETGQGTLAFYDRFEEELRSGIFQEINNSAISTGEFSTLLTTDHLWILSPSDGRITLADPDFLTQSQQFAVNNPFEFAAADDANTVWLTQKIAGAATGFITKIDSLGFVSASLAVGFNPGQPLISGSTLYCPNGNGEELDSTITIINLSADTVQKQLILPRPNPVSGVSAAGSLWFLCQGNAGNNSEGALVTVSNREVDFAIALPAGASSLTASTDGTYLFYVSEGKIFRQPTESINRNTEVFIDKNYDLIYVDSNTNELFAVEINNDNTGATIFRYNVETAAEIGSFTTPNRPNQFLTK